MTVALPVVLDCNNAAEAFSSIVKELDDEIKEFVFDAKNLRYISADGLDVILDTKKRFKNVAVDNARVGICDILESYGFDRFLNISKQYRFVSIEGCKVIGHGKHGTIYQLDEGTIIKVYRDHSALEVIENERLYARNAFINGIPTAIAYDVVETERGYGVIFEMINGMTLGQYLNKHPEKAEEYSIKFADLLYTLHSTTASPDLYPDFHDVYLDRADNTKEFLSEEESETLKRIINSIPRGHGMVHGDYHPNNVMIDDEGELMLIDMADISMGNGFFDLGGTYMVMHHIAKIPVVRLFVKNITSLDAKTCLKMWDIMIKEYYILSGNKGPKGYDESFKAFSNLRIAASLGMKSSRSPIITKLMALYTKKLIIPKADEYIKAFSNKQ